MDMVGLVFGILVGLVLLVVMWKPFFGTGKEFRRCLGYLFMPNLLSALFGDLQKDWEASLKIQLWLLTGVVAGVLVYLFAANGF